MPNSGNVEYRKRRVNVRKEETPGKENSEQQSSQY